MKATMNESGTILIVPETPLEAYALSKWAQESFDPAQNRIRSDKLLVTTQIEGAQSAEGGSDA